MQGEQNQHQRSKLPLPGTFSPFFDQQSRISVLFSTLHTEQLCVCLTASLHSLALPIVALHTE